MSVTINPGFEAALLALIDERIGSGVRELRDIAKAKVGVPYPPASEPGNPPHRRSGGLQDAIFAERIDEADWAFGVNAVATDPDRPGSNRERLGLWMELGTGSHRQRPGGETAAPDIVRTSVEPRPFLVPTLVEDGPTVVQEALNG